MQAITVSDLHGNLTLYELLLRVIDAWRIGSVFIAGDLLPPLPSIDPETVESADLVAHQRRFIHKDLIPLFESFFATHRQTHIYAIVGNDDCRAVEPDLLGFDEACANLHIVHNRAVVLREAKQLHSFFPGEVPVLYVAGYPYVPPGAGLLMDWVKYENRLRTNPMGMDPCLDVHDVGIHTVEHDSDSTIAEDLADFGRFLVRQNAESEARYEPRRTIHLFHSPPYNTPIDWMPPGGRFEHLPLPDHGGSSEIRRFIRREQPYLFLCGHCHEAVIHGSYKTQIGETWCANAGSQTTINVLSVVQFDLRRPAEMKQLFVNAE